MSKMKKNFLRMIFPLFALIGLSAAAFADDSVGAFGECRAISSGWSSYDYAEAIQKSAEGGRAVCENEPAGTFVPGTPKCDFRDTPRGNYYSCRSMNHCCYYR